MANFQTFDLGQVLQTAEAIKGARRQSKLDELREISARQQIDATNTKATRDTVTFEQEQQIENTRLLNAAAAEISNDPSAAQRWVPMLQSRGVLRNDIGWQSAPPEKLQATAKQIFDSTSAALGALRSSTTGSASMVQSTFQGQNGNAWVMTRDGHAVDTGVPMQKFAPQARDVAGGVSVFDPNVRGVTTQLSSRQQEIDAAAAKVGAEQSARAQAEISAVVPKAQAESQAQAQINLPQARADAQYMTKLLGDLKSHPGLPAAVGVKSVTNYLPGTEAANFRALLDQVGGKQFLEAFESLKGGGAITQIEGEKASQAIARMSTAQSEAAFIAAVTEFQGIVNNALKRAEAKAKSGGGQQPQQQTAPARITSDAEFDALPSGAVFLAPDGTQRRKP